MAELNFIKTDTLVDIANAIREQEGSEEDIKVSDFASRIEDLNVGGLFECEIVDTIPTTNMMNNEQLLSYTVGFRPIIALTFDKGAFIDNDMDDYSFIYQNIIGVFLVESGRSIYGGASYSVTATKYPAISAGSSNAFDSIIENDDGTYTITIKGGSKNNAYVSGRTYRTIIIGKFIVDESEES